MSTVERVLAGNGIDSRSLAFEVTETMIMVDQDRATRTLDGLRSIGVAISIDDFGIGYSSLSQLKSLPLNELKIDKSFVMDIPKDEDDMAIIRAVIALGRSMNLRVIAEGVETDEQSRTLQGEGCEFGQGYFYCHPLPADQFESYLENNAV